MQWELETSGPVSQVGNWVFIAIFLLPKDRDVSVVKTDIS
jgi:hypothetical protein